MIPLKGRRISPDASASREKGSALLTALFLVLFLSSLAFLLLDVALRGTALSSLRETDNRNFWIALGAESLALERLSASGFPDFLGEYEGRVGEWKFGYRLVRNPRRTGVNLVIRTRTGRQDRTLTLPLGLESYADYLLLMDGDAVLAVSEGRSLLWNGPVLVNRTLRLQVGGSLRLASLRQGFPPFSCREMSITNRSSGKGEIILESTLPGKGYRVWLMKDGLVSEQIRSEYVREGRFRNFVTLEGVLEALKKNPPVVHIGSRDWNRKTNILNARLLEKEFAGTVRESAPVFRLKGRQSVPMVYFSDDPSDNVMNPFRCADSLDGEKDFLFGEERLSFPRRERKLTLRSEDCRVLGVFGYGLPGTSASSLYREISGIRVDGERMTMGRDVEIDRRSRTITLFRPSFAEEIARCDGRTSSFQAPSGFSGSSVLFLNRARAADFVLDSGRIVFRQAPPAGSRLVWYKKMPEISFIKENPPPGTAVFVDKVVEMNLVELDRLPYPSGSVLIFDAPILVRGKTGKNFVIATTEDIYLDDSSSSTGLCLYGRLFWSVPSVRPLIVKNAFLFSGGDGLPTAGGPERRVHLTGSLVLGCRYRSVGETFGPDSLVWGKTDPLDLRLDPPEKSLAGYIPVFMSAP